MQRMQPEHRSAGRWAAGWRWPPSGRRWAVFLIVAGVLLAAVVAVVRPRHGGEQPAGAPAPAESAGIVPAAAPGGSGAPVLIGAGDMTECGGNEHDEATAKLLEGAIAEATGPVAVFTAGDNAYPNGTEQEFANCYAPAWGRVKDRTHPAAGNHDYRTREAAPYFHYFGAAAGDPRLGYYSYNLGTWHIVVLNSNCREAGGCGAGSAQERWLRADLAANAGAACTLAYWHHPRFSNGGHSNDATYQAFWQALYDYGADVVLAGHDHNYQRYAPLDPTGHRDEVRGMREFVVGTGGTELYSLHHPTPNTDAQSAASFGVLKLTLRAGSYDWQFLPTDAGGFTDSGSGICH